MTARWAKGAPRARMTAEDALDDGCVDGPTRRDARETRVRTDRSPRARDRLDRSTVRGRDGRARARVTRSSVVGRRSSCVVRSIGFTSVSNRFHIDRAIGLKSNRAVGFTSVSNRACGRWVSHRGGGFVLQRGRDATRERRRGRASSRRRTGPTIDDGAVWWIRVRTRGTVRRARGWMRTGRVASRIRTARVDEERRRNGTTSRLRALGDANSAFGPFV
jgi:hypothetical protein